MDVQPHLGEALIREIGRYLEAVDLFRAERCEPMWLPEPPATGTSLELSAFASTERRTTSRAA